MENDSLRFLQGLFLAVCGTKTKYDCLYHNFAANATYGKSLIRLG